MVVSYISQRRLYARAATKMLFTSVPSGDLVVMQQCLDTGVTRVGLGDVGFALASPPKTVGTSGFGQTTARVRNSTPVSAGNSLPTPPPSCPAHANIFASERGYVYDHLATLRVLERVESIDRDRAFAQSIVDLEERYFIRQCRVNIERHRNRGAHVYHFVNQAEVLKRDEPLQRRPKNVEISPLGRKLSKDIKESIKEGYLHKERLCDQRHERMLRKERAAQQKEYEEMKHAPRPPPPVPSRPEMQEKTLARIAYQQKLWSRKVQRNKEHASLVYEAKQFNKKFVAPLSWDQVKPSKPKVASQKVPSTDLPPSTNESGFVFQADPTEDEQNYGDTPFAILFTQFWPSLCAMMPEVDLEKAKKFCENLLLLYVNLRQCMTWTHMTTTLLAWVSSNYSGRLVPLLIDMVKNVLGSAVAVFKNQAGGESILKSVREAFALWNDVVHGQVVLHIKKIIAILVAAGVCSFSNLPFGAETFAKFYTSSGVEKLSSIDMLTQIFDTIIFMWERGLAFFTTGKWRSFFSSHTLPQKFEMEYAFLLSKVSILEVGLITKIGMEESEYLARVDDLHNQTKEYLRTTPNSHEKKMLTDKLMNVEKLKTRIFEAFKMITMRRKPMTILFYGTTNLGKSVTIPSVHNGISQYCGLPTGLRYKVSLNGDDKFQSEVMPWHTMYTLDDLSTTNLEYTDANVTQLLINLSNNEPKYALKAGVEQKGQVLMNPLILIGSTNIKDLQTSKLATYPIATMRRFEAIVTPTVRPEYALANGGGLDVEKCHGLIGEYCTYNIERAVPIKVNPTMPDRRNQPIDQVGYEFIKHKFEDDEAPRPLEGITYHEMLTYLCVATKAHLTRQAKLVAEMENLHEKKLCEHSSYPEVCPKCLAMPKEPEEVDLNGLLNQGGECAKWAVDQYRNCNSFVRTTLHAIPAKCVTAWARQYDDIVSRQVSKLRDYAFVCMVTGLLVTVPCFTTTHMVAGPLPAMFVALLVYTYVVVSTMKARFARTVKAVVSAPFDQIASSVRRQPLVGPLLAFSGIVAAVHYARKMYSHYRTLQGVVNQGSEEKVPVPDKVARVNHWRPVHVSKPPVDVKLRTATNRQVCDVVGEKLCRVTFRTDDGRGMNCNALPLQSNVWLVPHHVTTRGFTTMTVHRCKEGAVGPTFVARVAPNVFKQVGTTDLAVVYVPAGGSQADLMHLFPHGRTQGTTNAAMCVYKRPDFSIMYDTTNVRHVLHKVGGKLNDALQYKLSENTFPGLCMATIVAMGKLPYIMGFHVGGYEVEDTTTATKEELEKMKLGVAVQVTKQELQAAIDTLYTECHMAVKVASESTADVDVPEKDIRLTGDLHYKSPLRFIDQAGSVTTWGSHTGRRVTQRSDVQPSVITKEVEECFGVPNQWGPPHNMNSYQPWRADVMNLTAVQDLPPDIVEKAYIDMRDKIFAVLKEDDKKHIHPYTWDVALSGADGVYGVDGLNLNTSTGWPWNEKKWKILTPSAREVEGITRPLDMPEGMQERLEEYEETLAQGKRVWFVHRANLKDEPTKLDKDKVRVFAGAQLELTILFRKYFLSICKYIMEHPTEFECAVGVNAHGPEWSRLVVAMAKYGKDRMIAGDYKAFDSCMAAMISLLGFKLMIEIAAWAGYTPRQLTIMLGIATEICYPLYEYNGEFDLYASSNPSGHGGTVFINTFAGMLYFRIAFYILAIEAGITQVPPFHTVVSLLTYGDDNGASVREGCGWFNHTAIAEVLGRYGVTYTMADKTSESVPYIQLEDLEFLKRKPVWSGDFELYLAPLKEMSILKSLHSVKFSKSLTRQEHAAACIVGAVSEYFQHGEQVYTDRIGKLRRVIAMAELDAYLPDKRLPDYAEMEFDYRRKYLDEGYVVDESVPVVEGVTNQAENFVEFVLAVDPVDDFYLHMNPEQAEEIDEWIQEFVAQWAHDNPRVLRRRNQMSHCRTLTAGSLKRPYLHRLPTRHRIAKRRCVYRHADLERRDLESQPGYTAVISPNSDELDGLTETENQTYSMSTVQSVGQHQNLVFRDGAPQWGVGLESAMDSTRMVATHDDVTLGEFLARPVQIASYTWIPGTAFTITRMNPWDLFFSQSRVINRINNYGLIQPKQLKVKININGTSFHYGRLLVHYIPLVNNTTSDPQVSGDFTKATQRMHLTLDPCTSQGGEMNLPFIWPYNALDLTVGQWDQLGTLTFEEFVPLKHANGGTAAVNITVYAWAEDVKLSIPTTLNSSKIVAQADEFGTGSVGRVASAVSKASGALSMVPSIAPFAKATGMIAQGMGAVAKAYGFSRPPIISDLMVMRPRLIGNMANTDCGDPVVKLTVDSKQELTIDPRVFGVDTGDEMVLTNIAGKQAWFAQFTWAVGTAPGALLWNVRVNPVMNQLKANAGYDLLPCAFAATPFKWWRGTIRYRFQIVASAYHKGRLRFVYDPHRLASDDQNIAYTRIVDLANERDFTLDVAWGQPVSWLRVPRLGYTGANGSTTAYTTDDLTLSNGLVSVKVLNDLTTPNDVPNNDITILVYASMCDDAEFDVLDDTAISGLTFKNQAEEFKEESLADDNAPLDIGSKECMSECLPLDNTLLVHFGESVTSLRTALKRYNLHASYQYPTNGLRQWQLVVPTFPNYPGIYTTGINVTAATPSAGLAVNFNNMTLMNFVTPAFLAQRGSIRSKYTFFSDAAFNPSYTTIARAVAQPVPATFSNFSTGHVTTNASLFSQNRITEIPHGLQGLDVTYNIAQSSLEVEHPYYNLKRFDSARDPGYTQANAALGFVNMAPSDSHLVSAQFNSTAYAGVDRYIAAGEDFQLFLFQGLPTVYVRTFS